NDVIHEMFNIAYDPMETINLYLENNTLDFPFNVVVLGDFSSSTKGVFFRSPIARVRSKYHFVNMEEVNASLWRAYEMIANNILELDSNYILIVRDNVYLPEGWITRIKQIMAWFMKENGWHILVPIGYDKDGFLYGHWSDADGYHYF